MDINSILNKLTAELNYILCNTLSDSQIINATINGEAKGEPKEGQQAVRTVIYNRSIGPAYFRNKHKLYGGSSSEAKACLAPNQFSVWNNSSTCAAILAAYTNCMSGATVVGIPKVNHSIFTNGTGLTLEQAKKIYLYLNPTTTTSKAPWVKLMVSQNSLNKKKRTWKALVTFQGRKVKLTFIRIGAHLFVHGIQ